MQNGKKCSGIRRRNTVPTLSKIKSPCSQKLNFRMVRNCHPKATETTCPVPQKPQKRQFRIRGKKHGHVTHRPKSGVLGMFWHPQRHSRPQGCKGGKRGSAVVGKIAYRQYEKTRNQFCDHFMGHHHTKRSLPTPRTPHFLSTPSLAKCPGNKCHRQRHCFFDLKRCWLA